MKRVCFTGHRPSKLYGYDLENPEYQKLAKFLRKLIIDKYLSNGFDEFMTGGALGFDAVAFFTVNDLKRKYDIKNILAIPYKNQSIKWSDKDKDRYNRMITLADEVIYVDNEKGYENYKVPVGTYHISKLNTRNNYMVNTSSAVIALCDGSESGTKNCVDYANMKSKLVSIIDFPSLEIHS